MAKKEKKPTKANVLSRMDKPINSLIIFSIFLVSERQEKCTFERLLAECFHWWPNVFSFAAYPEWPDARKLDRPLRFLRDEKIISGGPKSFFVLTKEGQKIGAEIAKTFRQGKLKI
ncbi:MAG: hypothetical protein ABIF89_00300 [bacterium]